MVLVLVKKVLHHVVVENLGTLSLRSKKVYEEEKLDPIEIGNEVEDKAEQPVGKAEEPEDDPISEPFLVIFNLVSL